MSNTKSAPLLLPQVVNEEKKRRRSIDQGLMGHVLKHKGLDKVGGKIKKKLTNLRDKKDALGNASGGGGGGIFARFSKKFSKRVSAKSSISHVSDTLMNGDLVHDATGAVEEEEEELLVNTDEQKSE